jgi:hypothetical protein
MVFLGRKMLKAASGRKAPVRYLTGTAVGVALVDNEVKGGSFVYVDGEGYTVEPPGQEYFDSHPAFMWEDEVIPGHNDLDEHMVRIPRFYTRTLVIPSGPNAGRRAWWVSDQPGAPEDGFSVHQAFLHGGVAKEQFWMSKYQGSGSYFRSAPDVLVRRGQETFEQCRTNIENANGSRGFTMWNVHHLNAIQWLFLIENATFDSQAVCGVGHVGFRANISSPGVLAASYRGVTGLWGNVHMWVYGLRGGIVDANDNCELSVLDNEEWVETGLYNSNFHTYGTKNFDHRLPVFENLFLPGPNTEDRSMDETWNTSLVPDLRRPPRFRSNYVMSVGNATDSATPANHNRMGLWAFTFRNNGTSGVQPMDDPITEYGTRTARII